MADLPQPIDGCGFVDGAVFHQDCKAPGLAPVFDQFRIGDGTPRFEQLMFGEWGAHCGNPVRNFSTLDQFCDALLNIARLPGGDKTHSGTSPTASPTSPDTRPDYDSQATQPRRDREFLARACARETSGRHARRPARRGRAGRLRRDRQSVPNRPAPPRRAPPRRRLPRRPIQAIPRRSATEASQAMTRA